MFDTKRLSIAVIWIFSWYDWDALKYLAEELLIAGNEDAAIRRYEQLVSR